MKTSIIVTSDKIAFHKYDDVPNPVSFLRNRHRHKFFIQLELEVFHDDRELEFFTVQSALNEWLKDKNEVGSCEMLAKDIHDWASKKYRITDNNLYTWRKTVVEVWEDKENGARVE